MKYEVRYSKTINYLVEVEAENEDDALEAAEQAIETSNMKLIDINPGEIEFESIAIAPIGRPA